MKLAFVSNGRRTATFSAVADRLLTHGHEVFWIATGSGEVADILAPYVGVLDISVITDACASSLEELDAWSDISVNGIIASDRILSKKPENLALAYLSSCFKNINKYLADNNIELVSGEATWANEMVCAAVCNKLGIPYLAPASVRYPADRFAFFRGVLQHELVDTGNVPDISAGQRLFDTFIDKGGRPFYMDKPRRNKFAMFLKHMKRHIVRDVHDMTVPSISELIASDIYNRLSKAFSASCKALPDKYIYLPLHVYPEASVDVLAGFHRDVVSFVSNVSRAVPYGVKLLVKEHPSKPLSIRERSRISSLPAVVIADTECDSLSLIKGAEAVVSLSGTACYEAGLLGVHSFIFAETFFAELPLVKKCTSYEELYAVLKKLSRCENATGGEIAFLARLNACSYSGYVESDRVYADALTDENISKITAGFLDILDYYSSSKSAIADSMCSRLI